MAYFRASLIVWSSSIFIFLVCISFIYYKHIPLLITLWILFLILIPPLVFFPLRRKLLSQPILNIYRKYVPNMSPTEKEALEAGTVDWDGQLFSGKPNWEKYRDYEFQQLNEEEREFLNGPVEELCRMTDDWDITHNRANLPPEMWQFIKANGFFGLIIPKKYGGKGFSAIAHSAVITKLSSKSVSVATSVSVPNSLGPAELLLNYGTKEQKEYYLPRLAAGEEIPCFGLTGLEAGSDAGAMADYGIVCRDSYNGKEIVGIRLSWQKRYITLAPIATVLGIAFKLYDPEHFLGDKVELGITCALIPANTPGVVTGRRHFPLNAAFLNGPTEGNNVFIPISAIIGGEKMAGQGWRMLVECLSAGRAISLPSTVMGGIKIGVYATGAYSRIRRQFGVPIGRFGGVEEALTRILGYAYIADATRIMTVAAIDRGEKPSVLSAITKYHCTELSRKIGNDAMDVHGGKGIQLGPRNYLGRGYEMGPIGITVEGANILTRSLIIFGQGAIRCHPYVYPEMLAAKNPNKKQGLIEFDKAFFGHLGFIISNSVRAFILGITNGIFSRTPTEHHKKYFQQVTRFSAAFAYVADVAMIYLGGMLKRKEKLSARLGDVLSMMYMVSAVLKRHEIEGYPEEDQSVIQWTCEYLFYTLQTQLDGFLKNFPNKWIAMWLRFIVFPLGLLWKHPCDDLGTKLADLIISPSSTRQRLADGAYLTNEPNNPVGKMEETLQKVIAIEDIQRRMHKAKHDRVVTGYTFEERVKEALGLKIITPEEAEKLLEARQARLEVYRVDDFTSQELERIVE